MPDGMNDFEGHAEAQPAGVIEAAKALRSAQRAYLADRGNEQKGLAVGAAAAVLDGALAKTEATAKLDIDPDTLAQFIRKVDGNHKLGAGALAELIAGEFAAPAGEVVGYLVSHGNGVTAMYEIERTARSVAASCGGTIHKLIDGGEV